MPSSFARELYPYQQECENFLADKQAILIADEMG
jgi:hypothetical protein